VRNAGMARNIQNRDPPTTFPFAGAVCLAVQDRLSALIADEIANNAATAKAPTTNPAHFLNYSDKHNPSSVAMATVATNGRFDDMSDPPSWIAMAQLVNLALIDITTAPNGLELFRCSNIQSPNRQKTAASIDAR